MIYDGATAEKVPENIKVEIARPNFPNSDDMIVNIGTNLPAEGKVKTLFVTGDRGLQDRLRAAGCLNLARAR